FNDNRVTMKGDWGQGAHNALNIVGDFFQQALKARAIDPKLRFTAPRQQDMPDPLVGRMNDWFNGLFRGASETPRALKPPSLSDGASASAEQSAPIFEPRLPPQLPQAPPIRGPEVARIL